MTKTMKLAIKNKNNDLSSYWHLLPLYKISFKKKGGGVLGMSVIKIVLFQKRYVKYEYFFEKYTILNAPQSKMHFQRS